MPWVSLYSLQAVIRDPIAKFTHVIMEGVKLPFPQFGPNAFYPHGTFRVRSHEREKQVLGNLLPFGLTFEVLKNDSQK